MVCFNPPNTATFFTKLNYDPILSTIPVLQLYYVTFRLWVHFFFHLQLTSGTWHRPVLLVIRKRESNTTRATPPNENVLYQHIISNFSAHLPGGCSIKSRHIIYGTFPSTCIFYRLDEKSPFELHTFGPFPKLTTQGNGGTHACTIGGIYHRCAWRIKQSMVLSVCLMGKQDIGKRCHGDRGKKKNIQWFINQWWNFKSYSSADWEPVGEIKYNYEGGLLSR